MRHIKSRKHPEKTIVNRAIYERSVQLASLRVEAQLLPSIEDDEADEDDEVHSSETFTPSTTNSFTRHDQVRWPTENKMAGRSVVHSHGHATKNSPHTEDCCRRWLATYLGEERVTSVTKPGERVRDLRVREMDSMVIWIGNSQYATATRESRKATSLRTTRAWFAIPGRHVPAYVEHCRSRAECEPHYDLKKALDKMVHGRFLRFYQLRVAGTREEQYSVASVELFATLRVHPVTQLATITTRKMQIGGLDTVFIDMTKVAHPIALAPVLVGLSLDRKSTMAGSHVDVMEDQMVVLPVVK